jgi:uncharacterized protein
VPFRQDRHVTSGDYPETPRTRATRSRDRVSYDRTTVHATLDEAVVCHVGFVVDGRPVVLPQLHARVGERLYLHGSTGARALRLAEGAGLDVCVTVTLVDGLVLARSAFHHSINYRSVVVLGDARVITDREEKHEALRMIVEHVTPGRADDARGPSDQELAATEVVGLAIREASAKVRTGPPIDAAEDYPLPVWAGELPLALVPGEPIADERCSAPLPAYVSDYRRVYA